MVNIKICTLCLLLFGLFSTEIEAARCCLNYRKSPIDCRNMKGYYIQDITKRCDIPAIVFQTMTGRLICADPKENWTQKRVSCLKMKAERMKTGNMF
ncbi:C-C motif chemokine 20b [Triplophysa rosa]|uniref:C-C motif chemokine n=1 Tax=Triplophysa rosa TaxID=992332 RepID=A0A9W7WBC9_TRIRA|nr:C-C motif chemokine 20b [Triplophysa rosa]KAI7792604.1 chemokine C-C motif ligand 20b precursor [Triplophysa rosa]